MATKYKLTYKLEKEKDAKGKVVKDRNGKEKIKRKRWRKRYKSKDHWFNCRKGETKTQSYVRCLAAWQKKKAIIDGNAQANEPWFVAITKLTNRAKARMAELELEDTAENRAAWNFAYAQLQSYEWYLANGVDIVGPDGDYDNPVDGLGGWPDHDDRDTRPPWEIAAQANVVTDESLDKHVQRYVKSKEDAADRGELSISRYEAIRTALKTFVEFVGARRPVTALTTATLTQFRELLQNRVDRGMSDFGARDQLQVVKQFTKWAWEQELIDLPRILQSKAFTISVSERPIVTFTNDEVATLLTNGSERTQLYLFLMLNCGMQQSDISDLRQDEVDWKKGYLTRKRSKTRKSNGNVPTVSYKLWPQTFKLLKRFRSTDKSRALTNANGSPLKTESIVGGKMKRVDNIKSAWRRLSHKTGITKPPKLLRKTAATQLGNHPEFGRFAQHFLGHAPSNVADRHYITPSQEQFDEAVTWLGEQFNTSTG